MDKDRKISFIILIILGAILIPITGITLALKGPLFFKSLSRIAADGRHFFHLIFLGNIVIIFLLMSIFYLKKYHNLGSTLTSVCFLISCVLLEVCVLVPYVKEEFILLKNIHNGTAYTSVVLLVISLFFFVMTMSRSSRSVFKTTVISLIIVVGIAGFIFEFTGNPSAFFETTLVILSCNLILFTMYLLYRNEKAKENGSFNVSYKIVEKSIMFYGYELPVEKMDKTSPLKLVKKAINWKEIKKAHFNHLHIEDVFVYFDKNRKATLAGIKDPKFISEELEQLNFETQKWAVFLLDDQLYKTKQYTWKFIEETFKNNDKYEISNEDYIEKYYVTKSSNVRKGEIWIPIKEKIS